MITGRSSSRRGLCKVSCVKHLVGVYTFLLRIIIIMFMLGESVLLKIDNFVMHFNLLYMVYAQIIIYFLFTSIMYFNVVDAKCVCV